ncbi:VWA domain-containing protein [candidate division KSB1 bacterium]|nr:VWA domain-containing protein [candidate division KSB1 bacterium]
MKFWPRARAHCALSFCFLLMLATSQAPAQTKARAKITQAPLTVRVNNIAIGGEYSLRGLTGFFPHPILTTISITDQNGFPVAGLADTARWLGPQDLAENGQPISQIWQQISEYHRDNPSFPLNPDLYNQTPAPLFTEVRRGAQLPTSTMLVMDISSSIANELNDAKIGVLTFLQQLRPVDRAGLIQFCRGITELHKFTNDKAPLMASVMAAQICPGTAIYISLMQAIQETKSETNRRAIILYTDGMDNRGGATPEAIIDSARAYNIPIHTIALGTGASVDILGQIAAETGGLFFQARRAAEFTDIYQRLLGWIQNFYVMAHTSPDPNYNGTWRMIDVTVDRHGDGGRGQGQYFVPGTPRLRATDLAVSMASITEIQMLANNKIFNAVAPGDAFSYSIQVRNLGPERAENVRLTQKLPDSVRFVNATSPTTQPDASSLVWEISRLDAGGVEAIEVSVNLAREAPPALEQLVSRVDLFAFNDTLEANNAATDTVLTLFSPLPPIDAAVAQTPQTDSSATVGNQTFPIVRRNRVYTYMITVKNESVITARNVKLRDFLPDEVVQAQDFEIAPESANARPLQWTFPSLGPKQSLSFKFKATVAPNLPTGIHPLVNKVEVEAGDEDQTLLGNNAATATVYYITRPTGIPTPLIAAMPPLVDIGEPARVQVQFPVQVRSWDLWVYFADGDIDQSFADDYISTTLTGDYAQPLALPTEVWHEVPTPFTNTRLFTAAKREKIIFEIRTIDVFGNAATDTASIIVQSGNDLYLDRNVYEPEVTLDKLRINFKLSSNRVARLDVFDVNGKRVCNITEAYFNAGWNHYDWNGVAENGQKVGSGVYLVTLRSGEYNSWKKFIIAR